MKNWFAFACLALTAFGFADDASLRSEFQAKYDQIDAAMSAGDLAAFRKMAGSSFVATDIQKRTSSLGEVVRQLTAKKTQKVQNKTRVESADTLDGKAKTALRIHSVQVLIEGGKAVTYDISKTQEDTWVMVGMDWKLVGSRLTSNRVVRNGKTIVNQAEHVLTDWDRNYRRRSSSRRG